MLIDLGLLDRVHDLEALGIEMLFPEWTPYRKTTGELRWGQPITKSWQYVKKLLGITRADLTLYGTRHWMADMLDNGRDRAADTKSHPRPCQLGAGRLWTQGHC